MEPTNHQGEDGQGTAGASFPKYFWAKTTKDANGREIPGISVRDHCLNVGCVAEAIVAMLPPAIRALLPGDNGRAAVTLAALHDVGKITVGFQAKCQAWLREFEMMNRALRDNWHIPESNSNHGKVTAWTLRDWLRHRWSDGRFDLLAHAVGAHHGSLFGSKVFAKPFAEKARELMQQARWDLCDALEGVFGKLPADLMPPQNFRLWVFAGLVTVADWIGSADRIGSEEVFFSPNRKDQPRLKLDAQNDAERALSAIGWKTPSTRAGLGFAELFGFDQPSELQRQSVESTSVPEVVLVEAAMGAGKTEAALSLAYRLQVDGNAQGLYFALPTQVTSNRIHRRVRDFLRRTLSQPALLRLAHANSWLQDKSIALVAPAGESDATPNVVRRWFSSAKRSLLAPFGVGTIDQALLGVVAAKHFFVRQFALAGKVVVLDEVHSYDLYTGTLVQELVSCLRQVGATVVILSATLTAKRKRELLSLPSEAPVNDAYPLLTILPRGSGTPDEKSSSAGGSRQVRVRCVQLSEAEAAAECLFRAQRGECVLWIRNTVAEAQAALKRLRSDLNGDTPEVALLHSRFPQFRRDRLERLWLNRLGKNPRRRPNGCVLVSTQVVEQSVDIDADFLLTDLAPTDMLLQRIGRLWRHQGRLEMAKRRPVTAKDEVWVNHPALPPSGDSRALKQALGKSARVYAPYVLLRTLAEWQRVSQPGFLTLPADIRPLLEATYDTMKEIGEPSAWGALRRELEVEAEQLRSKALSATRVWELADLDDEEGIQTRWSKVKTASLLLVRHAELMPKGELKLTPLHDRPFTINQYEWNFIAAKTIHRNLVRVDRWLVRDGLVGSSAVLTSAARALGRHAPADLALGIVEGEANGPIRWPGSSSPASNLFYDEDLGVERLTNQPRIVPQTTYLPDDDESCD